MICAKCNREHDGSFGSGKFCSKACANSRSWSDSDKKKKSESAKISEKVLLANTNETKLNKLAIVKTKPWIYKLCSCGTQFKVKPHKSKNKTCSDECRRKAAGGYRNGSGRAKTGYYKGIYCGSTYELVWMIYQLDHNNEFSRFEKTLEYNGKKYIPDFLQNGVIIEIKGYEKQDSVDLKTEVANKNGYSVLVKRKEDLTDEFNWVKNNYSYKNIQELYDDYKPKYEYVCDMCKTTFYTELKKKTNSPRCSRACGGKIKNKVW